MRQTEADRRLETRLAERELGVISTLAELHRLTARQLERWHYTGATPLARARAARRSLARLTDLGVLARENRRVGGVRAGSAGYIYALDLLGQRVAMRRGWLPPRRTRRPHQAGSAFTRHTLAVAELHLRLIEHSRAGSLELIQREPEPHCWRSLIGPLGSRQTLKPDSFVQVATSALVLSWFVELDRSTESLPAIERKLATYLAYWRSGHELARHGVQPRTLWLAPTQKRVDELQAVIGRQPVEVQQLFVVAPFERAIDALTGVSFTKPKV